MENEERYFTQRIWIKHYREVKDKTTFRLNYFLNIGAPVIDESGQPKTYRTYPESSTVEITNPKKYATAFFSNWLNEFCIKVHNSKREITVDLKKGKVSEQEHAALLKNEEAFKKRYKNWYPADHLLPFSKLFTHFNHNGKSYGISVGPKTRLACLDLDNKDKSRDDVRHTYEVHKIYKALLKHPNIFRKDYFWFYDEREDITGGHFWFFLHESVPSSHAHKSLHRLLYDLRLNPKIEIYPTKGSFIRGPEDDQFHPHNLRIFCGGQHKIPLCTDNQPDIIEIYNFFRGLKKPKCPSWQQIKKDFPFADIPKHYSEKYERQYYSEKLVLTTSTSQKTDPYSIVFQNNQPAIVKGKKYKGEMWSIICEYFIGTQPRPEQLNQIIRMVAQIMHFNNFTEDKIVDILYDNFEQVQPIRKTESSYFNENYIDKIKRIRKEVKRAILFKGCKNQSQTMTNMALSAQMFHKNGRKVWDLESMKIPFVKAVENPSIDFRDYDWKKFDIPEWFEELVKDQVRPMLPPKQQNRYLEFAIKFAVSCSEHANAGRPYSRRHIQDFMAINFATISGGCAGPLVGACEEIGLVNCYRKGMNNVRFYDIGKNASDVLGIDQYCETVASCLLSDNKMRQLERRALETVENYESQLQRIIAS